MRNRLVATLAAALTAVTFLLTPTPAQATTTAPASAAVQAAAPTTQSIPPSSCANASVCGYVNNNYQTNQGYEFIPTRTSGTCEVMAFRNAWSSAFNNSGRTIRIYKTTNCTGDYRALSNGDGRLQFSTQWGPTWDNTTDAIKFL